MAQLFAHQIQIDRSVGATQHIEPNDTPRSGEPSRLWFALTRKGGQVIPLEACDCRLEVYAQPRSATSTPIATPLLEPYSAEGYTDIPSTEVTFPQVGAYELVLVGEPKASESESPAFDAFELTFDVTVAQGTTVAPSPATEAPSTPIAAPNATVPGEEASGEGGNERIITDVVVEPVIVPPDDVTVPVGIGAMVILGLGVVFYGWRSGWGAKKEK